MNPFVGKLVLHGLYLPTETSLALYVTLDFIFIKHGWIVQGKQTDRLWKLYLEVLREFGPALHGVEAKVGGAATAVSLGPEGDARR